MSADAILHLLKNVRQTGHDQWIASCPAHDDRSPSLGVRECTDGRLLLHCFASCPTEAVLASLGLSFADVMPEKLGHQLPKLRRSFDASQVLQGISHEAAVVAVIAEDIAAGARVTDELRERLLQAAGRISDGLELSGCAGRRR